MRPLSFLFASILFCALAGCGESHDPSDIDSGGGTTDGGAMTTADGGGTTTADGGGMTTADGGGMTTVDGGGTTAVDGGGTATVDGGGTTTADGGGTTIRPDGGSGSITCGMTTCNTSTEQCCIERGAGGASSMCIPIGDACMGATTECDGPEDCMGGEVCCASSGGGGGGGGFAVSCAAECGGGFTSFELCHAETDCSDSTDMCCPIALMGISGSICSPRCFGVGP